MNQSKKITTKKPAAKKASVKVDANIKAISIVTRDEDFQPKEISLTNDQVIPAIESRGFTATKIKKITDKEGNPRIVGEIGSWCNWGYWIVFTAKQAVAIQAASVKASGKVLEQEVTGVYQITKPRTAVAAILKSGKSTPAKKDAVKAAILSAVK